MLSDRTIQRLIDRKELIIEVPAEEVVHDKQFQPASIDLRLSGVSQRDGAKHLESWMDGCEIGPGQFLLGSTLERLTLSPNIVGTVVGKSTVARTGLMVECAGLVDPGFDGELTLEMYNLSDKPIMLRRNMMICQMTLEWMDTTPQRVYGDKSLNSHYQGQTGPTPARY